MFKRVAITVLLVGLTVCVVIAETSPATKSGDTPPAAGNAGATQTIAASLLSKKGVVNAADYADLQDAIDALPQYGGIVFMPPGTYKLKKPLNLSNTYNSGDKTRWITLQGSGKYNTTISGDFPDSVIIDMTRAGTITMRDFTVAGKAKCMMLIARDKTGAGGGSNFFENLMIRGDDCDVAVMDRSGEVNRFVNCEIYVYKANATCLWFTHLDPLNIKSPYMGETGESSTTELRLYGTQLESFGINTVGLRVDGNASDISIIGGYFANSGFAAIYLDGTQGNLNGVQISNLRVEGENGLYNLYAKGAVLKVSISGGNWGSAGECIRYEDVKNDQFWPEAAADGWTIRDLDLGIQDHTIRHGGGMYPEKATGSQYVDGPGGRAVIRLDKMRNCRIENVQSAGSYRLVKKGASTEKPAPKTQAEREAIQTFALPESEIELKYFQPKQLICGKIATANTISVQKRDDVLFLGEDNGNRIETLNDHGVRRTYFGSGSRPEVQNLPAVEAKDIATPRTGDFAMLKKENGQSAPAFYDGKQWQFLAISTSK